MYINAQEILPNKLLKEIQKYVQGKEIYIPKESENYLEWGAASGIKEQLKQRNLEIYSRYKSGESIEGLMECYHLSFDSIRRIIHRIRKE